MRHTLLQLTAFAVPLFLRSNLFGQCILITSPNNLTLLSKPKSSTTIINKYKTFFPTRLNQSTTTIVSVRERELQTCIFIFIDFHFHFSKTYTQKCLQSNQTVLPRQASPSGDLRRPFPAPERVGGLD